MVDWRPKMVSNGREEVRCWGSVGAGAAVFLARGDERAGEAEAVGPVPGFECESIIIAILRVIYLRSSRPMLSSSATQKCVFNVLSIVFVACPYKLNWLTTRL